MTDFIQTALMDNIEGRSFLEGQGPIVPPPPPDLGTPTYAISLAPSSVREGNELVATITTSNLSNSTRLFVTIGSGGSAVSADFLSSPWPIVIENNKAILRIKPKIDNLIESGETVQLQLRTMSKTGSVVATSNTISITDIPAPPVPPPLPTRTRILTPLPATPPGPTAPTPSYTIAIAPALLVEHKVNSLYIYTQNVADSTDLYVTLNAAGTATYDDFLALPLRTTVSNNNASRSVFTVDDGLVETETVQFDLRTGSITGPVVATTGLLNLQDYVRSQLPPSYSFNLSRVSAKEGDTFTGNIETANVVNGTSLYIALLGGSTASVADFTGVPPSVVIMDKRASFSATVFADALVETAEIAQFGLYTDALHTNLVSASGLLMIDSDPGAVTSGYSIAIVPSSVAEGESVTATVTTVNVPNGTVMRLTVDGFQSANAADLVGSPWNVTINNNTASVTIATAVDGISEPEETFRLVLKGTQSSEQILATSNPVTITNISASPTYQIGLSHLTITEGQYFNGTITTSNVPNNTQLYVTLDTGLTASAADILGVPAIAYINNNSAFFIGRVVLDDIVEGPEACKIDLRTGSYTGPIVASSAPLLISNATGVPVVSYTIACTPNPVNEGGTITGTITTTNVPNGTTLYVTQGLRTTSDNDFAVVQWAVTINNNVGVFAAAVVADLITEGSEYVEFTVRTDSYTGTVVAVSELVNINDTSNAGGGGVTYGISVYPSTVNEGSTVTGTVTTANVANGTVLYITPSGVGTANDADFTGEPWSTTINNNSGSFTFTATADSTTEGTESKILHLRTVSASGTIVAASNVLTITDTSTGGASGDTITLTGSIQPADPAPAFVESITAQFAITGTSPKTIEGRLVARDASNNVINTETYGYYESVSIRTYTTSWSGWTYITGPNGAGQNTGNNHGSKFLTSVVGGNHSIEIRVIKNTQFAMLANWEFDFLLSDPLWNNSGSHFVSTMPYVPVSSPLGNISLSVTSSPYNTPFPTGMFFSVGLEAPWLSEAIEYKITDSTGATTYKTGLVAVNGNFNTASFSWTQAEQLATKGSSNSSYTVAIRRRLLANTIGASAWATFSGTVTV